MAPREFPTRRAVLLAGAGAIAGLAGCSDSDDSAGPDPTGTADGLDLREANVVGVTVEWDGDSVTFDVS
jgi:type IV pilus biogenesis protein CpaD/CtpE